MVPDAARGSIAVTRCTDPQPEGAMFFPDELLDFIRTHRDELTLSVYIEAAPTDPAARRNWRVRLRQGLADVRDSLAAAPGDEQDAFERCAAEVLRRLPNGDTAPSTHGWACFATASGATYALDLPDATETNVAWGPGARVVPYVRSGAEPDALVVRIDRQQLVLARWHDGVLEFLERHDAEPPHDVGPFMGSAPAPGFHAGTRGRTGTDEEQRQRTDATERLLVTARNRIVALAGREPVLLGGGAEMSARLLDLLPQQLAGRAMVVPGLTLQSSEAETVAAVHAAAASFDALLRARRVSELRELAHTRGRAAVGFAPAQAAADLGAIAELIFSERAWQQHPDEIESLVQRALFEGASVAVAPPLPDAPLDGDADGIIAGLRFPLPTPR